MHELMIITIHTSFTEIIFIAENPFKKITYQPHIYHSNVITFSIVVRLLKQYRNKKCKLTVKYLVN